MAGLVHITHYVRCRNFTLIQHIMVTVSQKKLLKRYVSILHNYADNLANTHIAYAEETPNAIGAEANT